MAEEAAAERNVDESIKSEEVSLNRVLKQEEGVFAGFQSSCEEIFFPDSDEAIDLHTEERLALRHLYPNTLVDLGRAGIIKMRVFREDGSSYFLPGGQEVES
ncbi:MAG: hypothetical protein OXF75_11195 [Acidimicrobiaceae bacterium]|nr:hypothetical protein [Acidimicrobiaceae bacterium]